MKKVNKKTKNKSKNNNDNLKTNLIIIAIISFSCLFGYLIDLYSNLNDNSSENEYIVSNDNNITINNITDTYIDNSNTYINDSSDTNNYNDQQETIMATVEFTCTYGYEFIDYQCIKETKTSAHVRKYCKDGTLNGNFCETEVHDSVSITRSAIISCQNYANTGMYDKCTCEKSGGEYLLGSCTKVVIRNVLANEEYYCDIGQTLSDRWCISKEYSSVINTYTCPDDYYLVGMICYKKNW